jgi:two-component system response regulator VicR
VKILLVDDDRELVDILDFVLRRAGFEPLRAYDAPSGRKVFADERPDLVVLDVNLGIGNGFELLADLRRQSQVPVVMLTGQGSEEDVVRGLELGADDYVTKPFSHRELVARIRTNLRRHDVAWSPPSPDRAELSVGPITLNVAEHTVTKSGVPLTLTVTEFRLLHYLMLNAGTAVPSRAILQQVWGYDDPGGTDVVRVTAHRLRRKIEDDPNDPRLLQTVAGVGLIFKEQPAQ